MKLYMEWLCGKCGTTKPAGHRATAVTREFQRLARMAEAGDNLLEVIYSKMRWDDLPAVVKRAISKFETAARKKGD